MRYLSAHMCILMSNTYIYVLVVATPSFSQKCLKMASSLRETDIYIYIYTTKKTNLKIIQTSFCHINNHLLSGFKETLPHNYCFWIMPHNLRKLIGRLKDAVSVIHHVTTAAMTQKTIVIIDRIMKYLWESFVVLHYWRTMHG